MTTSKYIYAILLLTPAVLHAVEYTSLPDRVQCTWQPDDRATLTTAEGTQLALTVQAVDADEPHRATLTTNGWAITGNYHITIGDQQNVAAGSACRALPSELTTTATTWQERGYNQQTQQSYDTTSHLAQHDVITLLTPHSSLLTSQDTLAHTAALLRVACHVPPNHYTTLTCPELGATLHIADGTVPTIAGKPIALLTLYLLLPPAQLAGTEATLTLTALDGYTATTTLIAPDILPGCLYDITLGDTPTIPLTRSPLPQFRAAAFYAAGGTPTQQTQPAAGATPTHQPDQITLTLPDFLPAPQQFATPTPPTAIKALTTTRHHKAITPDGRPATAADNIIICVPKR